MNLKNYLKLLLILGLCSGIQAQGMSYVKSWWYGKKAHIPHVKNFALELERSDIMSAWKSFMASAESERVECARIAFENLNLIEKCPGLHAIRSAFLITIVCDDLVHKYFAENDEIAFNVFSKTLKSNFADFVAFRVFQVASEKARLKCIENILTLPSSLEQKILIERICNLDPKYKKIFDDLKIKPNQSVNHIINNPTVFDIAKRFAAKDERKAMIDMVLAKEEELSKDYYTFVHGQRSEYYFPEKIYTLLWQLYKRKNLNDFIFAHVVPLIEKEEGLAKEERLGKSLIRDGRITPYDTTGRQKLLFMNYALFGNAFNKGSSSSYYVAKNENVGSITITPRDTFKIFNYEAVYNKYESEIMALAADYKQKSSYGNLLLIAIPKNEIDKYVYLARSGGYKESLYINGIGQTTNIKVIMETLRNNPEKIKDTDTIEFALIMTQKGGGLDPDTGIKIIPILSGDPAKLAELQKKEDALFAKIKAAIEAEENAKAQATAVNRANAIVNHLVLPGKDAQAIAPAKTMARINTIMGHIQPQQQTN